MKIRVYDVEPAEIPRRCFIWAAEDSHITDRCCVEIGRFLEPPDLADLSTPSTPTDPTSAPAEPEREEAAAKAGRTATLIVPQGKMIAREKFGPILRALTSLISRGKYPCNLSFTSSDNFISSLQAQKSDGLLVAWFSDRDPYGSRWRKEICKVCARMDNFIVVIPCSPGIHERALAKMVLAVKDVLDSNGNKGAVEYLLIREGPAGVINLDMCSNDPADGYNVEFVRAIPKQQTRLRNPSIRNWGND